MRAPTHSRRQLRVPVTACSMRHHMAVERMVRRSGGKASRPHTITMICNNCYYYIGRGWQVRGCRRTSARMGRSGERRRSHSASVSPLSNTMHGGSMSPRGPRREEPSAKISHRGTMPRSAGMQ